MTPPTSHNNELLLQEADGTVKLLEEKQAQIIQNCKQSLERQERSVEKARKQLENLNIGWSSEVQIMPPKPFDISKSRARQEEFLIARSKDLAEECKQFVRGWGTPLAVPIESHPLGNEHVRVTKRKERHRRIGEPKNIPQEAIGQAGPSRPPPTQSTLNVADLTSSYPPPRRSIFSTPAEPKAGWLGYASSDDEETRRQIKPRPSPLISSQRSNTDIKVPQVPRALRPKCLSPSSSGIGSNAFPLLPGPSYEENTTTPSSLCLSEQNKQLQRKLREEEEKGERGINESKGLFWGYSTLPGHQIRPQNVSKIHRTPITEFHASSKISTPVQQSSKHSRKDFKFSKRPAVESRSDGEDADLTMSSVRQNCTLDALVQEDESSQAGISQQSIEKNENTQERVEKGKPYVERWRDSRGKKELERAVEFVNTERISFRNSLVVESVLAVEDHGFEEVELKEKENSSRDEESEEEDWVVV
jgi:hypothetical protein